MQNEEGYSCDIQDQESSRYVNQMYPQKILHKID